jgi:RNA polymerase sigma factor (sigma-70 family)
MKKKNVKAAPLSRLSPREREVLKLVVEGRTSKEIAAVIGVKPASVHTYRSRIMAKLEIRDIASLVRFAIRQGLIRP